MNLIHLQIFFLLASSLAHNVTAAVENKCKVFTFFEDLTGGIKFEGNKKVHLTRHDHLQILRAWMRNWYANGWDPVILRMADALSHPKYQWYRKKFSQFPTVNWRAYEMTCYLRWLAFAEQDGGVFVDYDIMNFPIDAIPSVCGKCGSEGTVKEAGDMLVSYPKFWPMLVFGGRRAAEKLISSLAEYEVNPEKDQYEGKAHISDMIIVQNSAEHLFDLALPNPRNLVHFSTSTKVNLAERIEDEPVKKDLEHMTRFEWIRRTMNMHFTQRNRIFVFSIDGKRIDESVESLLDAFRLCPEPNSTDLLMMHKDAKLSKGEYPVCDYRLTWKLPKIVQANEWSILFVEPVEESIVRRFSGNPATKKNGLEAFYREPTLQNQLVKKLASSLLDKNPATEDELRLILDELKTLFEERKNFIPGLMNKLTESKVVVEYMVGFMLPSLSIPYVPPTIKHNISLKDSQLAEIKQFNWADNDFYEFIKSLWQEKFEAMRRVELQLEKYHGAPVSYFE